MALINEKYCSGISNTCSGIGMIIDKNAKPTSAINSAIANTLILVNFLYIMVVDEAFDMLLYIPYSSVIEILYNDFKMWPPQFEDITVSNPKQINDNLYRVDISFFDVQRNQKTQSQSFVVFYRDEWKFILSQYYIPEAFMDNILIFEDENYIPPNQTIA